MILAWTDLPQPQAYAENLLNVGAKKDAHDDVNV